MGFICMTAFMAAIAGGYNYLLNPNTDDVMGLNSKQPNARNGFVALYALCFFFANWGPNATTFVMCVRRCRCATTVQTRVADAAALRCEALLSCSRPSGSPRATASAPRRARRAPSSARLASSLRRSRPGTRWCVRRACRHAHCRAALT